MKYYKIEWTIYEDDMPMLGGGFNVKAKNKSHAKQIVKNRIKDIYGEVYEDPEYRTEMEFVK